MPLFQLPQLISQLVNAQVALNRLSEFLAAEEQGPMPTLPAVQQGEQLTSAGPQHACGSARQPEHLCTTCNTSSRGDVLCTSVRGLSIFAKTLLRPCCCCLRAGSCACSQKLQVHLSVIFRLDERLLWVVAPAWRMYNLTSSVHLSWLTFASSRNTTAGSHTGALVQLPLASA